MDTRKEISEFLTSREARITPDQAGLRAQRALSRHRRTGCPLWRRPFVSRMIDHPLEEAKMKYAMLVYPKPGSHDGLGDEEAKALTAEYLALRDETGCVDGAHLQPGDTATTVRGGGRENLISDGPYADTKEVLGGYYVFEASDLDAALEFAQRIPAVRLGGAIEVRPLVEVPVETAH